MIFDLAIRTAPRKVPVLNYSIETLRKAGFDRTIHIFAEPGEYCIKGKNIYLEIHKRKKGSLRNYDYALKFLIDNSDCKHIIVVSDDVIYGDLTPIQAALHMKEDYGYYSLFTHKGHPQVENYIKKEGWNRVKLGKNAWGGAYLFQKHIADRMTRTWFYEKHLAGKTERKEKHGQMSDGCVSECMIHLDLPMYYHNPSLVCTAGISSTLGHKQINDGYRFK